MAGAAPLVVLTPNPAVDRTLHLDRSLSSGALHRVRRTRELAGGKGVNLARAVRALEGDVVVAGFLGGCNGTKFRRLLHQEGLEGVFEDVPEETRECHALLDGPGHPTEINERGPTVAAPAWRSLLERLPAGELVISGSVPPGLTDDEFGEIVASLPRRPVVDMSGPSLAAAVKAGAALMAPNVSELASLMERASASVRDAVAFHETQGVPILLSMGAKGAAYVGERSYLAHAPEVAVDNPVGSGDCLLGAFLWARAGGCDLPEALRWGVAAGSDNARRGGGGNVTATGTRELYGRVEAEELR